MSIFTGQPVRPDDRAGPRGAKPPPVKPKAAPKAPSGIHAVPSRLAADRAGGGHALFKMPTAHEVLHGLVKAETGVLDTLAGHPPAKVQHLALGLTGAENLPYLVHHPLASIQYKGPFKVPTGPHARPQSDIALPWLPGAKAAKALGGLVGRGFEARTVEETAQHLEQAITAAKAEGYGPLRAGGKGQAPHVAPGEVSTATGGEAGKAVRESLHGPDMSTMGPHEKVGAVMDWQRENPKTLREQQNVLLSSHRGEKAAASQQAYEEAGGGLAGHQAAMKALSGAAPKVFWHNQLVDFNQSQLDSMVRFVNDHPSLRQYEKLNTVKALQKMQQGKVVAPFEQRLLERAFGKQTLDSLMQYAAGDWRKFAVDLLNVPRAIMSSFDLSAPFRQGAIAMVAHPGMSLRNFGPMVKAAASERYFQQDIMQAIHDSPLYPLAHKGRLALTDIGETAKGGAAELGTREEARMSNLAERLPLGVGRVIRGSDRAYVGFLNKTRMDYFTRLVGDAAAQGHDVNDEKLLKGIASMVNVATGRGNVPGVMQDHLATMNALFFSPRLLSSRLNTLSPFYYKSLSPFARREALKNFMKLGTTAVTILELARLGGARVNLDPTNSDFGKIRLGNTRIDFLAGFQQPIRLAAQLAEGKVTSSTTGRAMRLGTGFGESSRYDIIMRFLQGKLSPVPGLVVAAARGEDFIGNKINWSSLSSYENMLANDMLPFLAQDLYSLYTTSGPTGLLAGPLDLLGVGVQSYKAKPPSPRRGRSHGIFGVGSSGTGSGIFGGGP